MALELLTKITSVGISGGLDITGIVTASSFSGPISGTASLASGLTGTPDISIRNITGVTTVAPVPSWVQTEVDKLNS